MPFFVKDWLTATMHMTNAERGAYFSWLAFQWVNGVLPADEVQLARIGGVAPEEFARVWAIVGKKFDGDKHGLFNKRLEQVRKEAMRLRDARALGATLANRKRNAKRLAGHDAANDADHGAQHDAERVAQTTHTYTNTNTGEEKKQNGAARRLARAQRVSRETVLDAANEDWIRVKLAAPRRVGSQPMDRALKAWSARRAEGHEAVAILEGTERWAHFVAQTHQDPKYVMQLATFLGPERHFLADWEVPPEAVNDGRWSPPSDEGIDPP